MNLILFGFKSCGKTTLGKIIAKRLNRPFVDTDRLIERLHFNHTGEELNFRKIHENLGDQAFRKLESETLKDLKRCKDSIIALGGGFILNPENVIELAKLGQLVYLELDKDTLKKRILSGELPSFLDPMDKEGSFEKMYSDRVEKYEAIPAPVIALHKKTQDQVVLEICALIQSLEKSHGQ